tara:strand:+ start:518 stop:817 length:300 start_codon:yes stop_codon:yes gene_type:complete
MKEKERNKEIVLTMIVSLVVFYAAMYLLIAFTYWDIFNPFKWVLETPVYHPSLRVIILAGFALVVLISYLVSSSYVDKKIHKEYLENLRKDIKKEFFPK